MENPGQFSVEINTSGQQLGAAELIDQTFLNFIALSIIWRNQPTNELKLF